MNEPILATSPEVYIEPTEILDPETEVKHENLVDGPVQVDVERFVIKEPKQKLEHEPINRIETPGASAEYPIQLSAEHISQEPALDLADYIAAAPEFSNLQPQKFDLADPKPRNKLSSTLGVAPRPHNPAEAHEIRGNWELAA
ncbi:MAG: hypothetical protein JWN01_767 [Patescibacteria group bacterium]|nr:hypothetical protein [Patescibacteria group bacterium]